MVHPPTADALAAAVDFDLEIDLGNRQRVHVPQHLALHQTLQEGVPGYARHLPPSPPGIPKHRSGDPSGRDLRNERSTLIKNLRKRRISKNLIIIRRKKRDKLTKTTRFYLVFPKIRFIFV